MPPRRGAKSRKRRGSRSLGPAKPQSLLVLHLDSDRLHSDGLHLGDVASVAGGISSVALGSEVVCEDATSRSDLTSRLARLIEAGRKFDVVVVVGHSNAEGIRVGADLFVDWSAFAKFLKPFRPRRLLLVACQAGRWDAGDALFAALPALRRIYACPVNASKDFGSLMLFAVPYVVSKRRPKDDHVLWTQVASIAMTGRQLREWRRTSDKGNPDAALFDLLAVAADPVARAVPSMIRSLLGR